MLEAVLSDPGRVWSVGDLVARCDVGDRGLDAHLRGLEALDLVEHLPTGWQAASPGSPLAEVLTSLADALQDVSDAVPVTDL